MQERSISWLHPVHSWTRGQTCSLLVMGGYSNQLSHTSQGQVWLCPYLHSRALGWLPPHMVGVDSGR